MAQLKAEPVRMNLAAKEFCGAADRLNQWASDLKAQSWEGGLTSAAYGEIRRRLKNYSGAVDSAAKRAAALGTVLEQSAAQYVACEERLTDVDGAAPRKVEKDAEGMVGPGNTAQAHVGTGSSGSWWGYEIDDENPGITAWIGKASAEAKNDWAYAGVNGYLGKVAAKVKTEASWMKSKSSLKYKNGEWEETEEFSIFNVGASASAAASVLSGDAKAGVGDDMLGVEGSAEGTLVGARAKAEGQFSVGEDGVNAYLKGEALVAAAEGKASGTINFFGIELTGEIGGYAGAVGVEGKIGIEDNKFVLKGGVAALLGASAGISIGFNEEGINSIKKSWGNFVDFIAFWD